MLTNESPLDLRSLPGREEGALWVYPGESAATGNRPARHQWPRLRQSACTHTCKHYPSSSPTGVAVRSFPQSLEHLSNVSRNGIEIV